MFTIDHGWTDRLQGAVLPTESKQVGWRIDAIDEVSFVEPNLRILHGDPTKARVIVVAAPGAVGKSTYARSLAAATGSVVVDLAATEPLGGNFFVGGIANAFGHQALTSIANGSLGLIVDALDEAQLRSGSEGYAAGLLDLGNLVKQPGALPAAIFGRAAAADEAWLILSDAGLNPCLVEIEFFDEQQSTIYLERKLSALAAARPATLSAFARFGQAFHDLAVETRRKVINTPGGDDKRFAGYAPVLDAICAYSLDEENLNPSARMAELSATGPVALLQRIATSILERESKKVTVQIAKKHPSLTEVDMAGFYSPREQLARIASIVIGAPSPKAVSITDPEVRETYDRMVEEFAPQHPFLDNRNGPSNAAFAAYVLVWALTTNYAVEEARRALRSQPALGSGLFFDLYMEWLQDTPDDAVELAAPRRLDLTDVGALYNSFSSQAVQGEHPNLEINGEPGEQLVDVEFEMVRSGNAEQEDARSYGPFETLADNIVDFCGPVGGLHVTAPISMTLGDGRAVNVTAPLEIDVDLLELNGRELRVFKTVGRDAPEGDQVNLIAQDAAVARVERIVLHGASLSVSFPGDHAYPWVDYSAPRASPPNAKVGELRRRARKILTSFRSHSKGSLRRLAAKIEHARMMKKGPIGPNLLKRLLDDGILTPVNAGKLFYELHPDKLAAAFGMDYQAIQQQRWSGKSDTYFGKVD